MFPKWQSHRQLKSEFIISKLTSNEKLPEWKSAKIWKVFERKLETGFRLFFPKFVSKFSPLELIRFRFSRRRKNGERIEMLSVWARDVCLCVLYGVGGRLCVSSLGVGVCKGELWVGGIKCLWWHGHGHVSVLPSVRLCVVCDMIRLLRMIDYAFAYVCACVLPGEW